MSRKKALLVPANPKVDYGDAGATLGSIFAHMAHIEITGKVIWRLIPPGNSDNFYHACERGYFNNIPEKKVTHVFHVERIFSPSEKLPKKYQKYLIPGRHYNPEGEGLIQIVINGIYKLKRKHKISDFIKCSNKLPVEANVNYNIVYDRQFKHHDKQEKLEELISNYLYDLLQGKSISEADIENLFVYHLMSESKKQLIAKQGNLKKAGRLDLLFKDNGGDYVVYELKKGMAPHSTIKQIKKYMKECLKKYDIQKGKIRGIILCKDAPPQLYTEIKKEKDFSIKVCKYFFNISIK